MSLLKGLKICAIRCLAEIGAMTASRDDVHLPPLPHIPFPAATGNTSKQHRSGRRKSGSRRTNGQHDDVDDGSTSSSSSSSSSSDNHNRDDGRSIANGGAAGAGAPKKINSNASPFQILSRQAGPPPQELFFPTSNAEGKLGFRKEDTARKSPALGHSSGELFEMPSTLSSAAMSASAFAADDLDELSALEVGAGEEVNLRFTIPVKNRRKKILR